MSNIEDIDQLIKEILSKEEAKFYDDLEEQNIFQMVGGLFEGKNKWIMIIMNIVTIIFFILFIYCVMQFFNTEDVRLNIKWGIGSLLFLLGISMMKIFSWMQMDKKAIIREIKRLELQISSLSGKM